MSIRMIKFFITLLFSILFFSVNAQGLSVYSEMNYNTFYHSSLKAFQKEFMLDMPELPMEVTDDFPANYGYTFGVKIDEINTSFFYSYNSTGGKISYADYSGKIAITELLIGRTIGGQYEYQFYSSSYGNIYGLFRAFFMFNDFDIESTYVIDGKEEVKLYELKSFDIGGGFGVKYEYPLWFFNLYLSAGVDVVLGGDLKLDSKHHIENNRGEPVNANWTGFRTGIGVSVPFK